MEKLTRREVLLRMFEVVVGIGASSFLSFEDLLAAPQNKSERPAVIWLHGTSCSGCSGSLLDLETISIVDLITRFIDLVFHPDLSLATGHQVPLLIESLIESKRGYLFVFEGAIPGQMPHACMMAGKPIAYWVELLASHSIANVGAGTCAVFGGVTKMEGMVTGSLSLQEFLQKEKITNPLVNLPNCPMKPEHLAYTLLHFLQLNKLPELDQHLRPLHLFKHTIHERCLYYADFQENHFAAVIGEDGCLLHLGCQGPVTYNDCSTLGHNDNTNTCIRAGHPCVGCASYQFPRKIMFHQYKDTRVCEPT
ncbi:hydrogenase small subunit [Deltaproteobacteria bacterium TL4]